MRKTIDVTDFLGKETLATRGIQRALDALVPDGGILYFPRGTYVTGTLFLHSNITLHLDCGAEIAGSENIEDYPDPPVGAIEAPSFSKCLIFAQDAENIEFVGSGTINGHGGAHSGNRPMLMRFVDCKNIRFQGVQLRDFGSWGVHMIGCQNIHVHQITMESHVRTNNDGFDLDSCRDIFISDSSLSNSDDSICLKSTRRTMGENLVVTNCILSSDTAVFKTGTSTLSGFRNITIQNCVVHDCAMGTFKIICVDGGTIENVNISNIVMDRVGSPLFIRVGKRNLTYEAPAEMDFDSAGQANELAPGLIRNISVSNVQARVTLEDIRRTPIMLAGLADSPIQNVRLCNISASFCGGGKPEDRDIQVPEDEFRYPEQWFFGTLPAYALYARHVDGLMLEHSNFSLSGQDEREAAVFEDVKKLPRQAWSF